MNHRESRARCRHRFPKGESRGCPSPPDREHEAVSLPRAPMRQRLCRRSVCLTAGHSIFPSPSLTGWTAISCGCSSAGASRVRLMQAISYRALTAGVETNKKTVNSSPEWNGIAILRLQPNPMTGPELELTVLCWRSTSNADSVAQKKDPTQVAGSNHSQSTEENTCEGAAPL